MGAASDPWSTPTGVTPAQIRARLPAECFESSVPRSFFYLIRAVIAGAALVWAHQAASGWIGSATSGAVAWVLQAALTMAYALAQGFVFYALFLIGHDCGHGAFSRSPWLNMVVGNFVQGFVLVPHVPWRMTHAHHHAVTNNLDDDEGFGPIRHSWASPEHARTVQAAYWGLGISFLFYFTRGALPHARNHLRFWDPFFRRRKLACAVSSSLYVIQLGLIIALLVTDAWGARAWLPRLYLLPLIVFGSAAVLTFFAHHNDARTRWYSRDAWRYDIVTKTGTVDRTFGAFMDEVTCHIAYHQVHHIFPAIPHYHLKRATAAFRDAYPELATVSDEPFLRSTFANLREYQQHGYIPDDAQIVNMYDRP